MPKQLIAITKKQHPVLWVWQCPSLWAVYSPPLAILQCSTTFTQQGVTFFPHLIVATITSDSFSSHSCTATFSVVRVLLDLTSNAHWQHKLTWCQCPRIVSFSWFTVSRHPVKYWKINALLTTLPNPAGAFYFQVNFRSTDNVFTWSTSCHLCDCPNVLMTLLICKGSLLSDPHTPSTWKPYNSLNDKLL